MPRLPRLPRFRRRTVAGSLAAVLLLAVAGVGLQRALATDPPGVRVQPVTVDVLDGPARDQPVRLDATLYLPERTPAPAVLVAHGFGGSKASVASEARELAERGFVVLAYSARGFGRSTGQIALNSPDYEVADAAQLLDWLAERPQVRQDGPGDPRVGVTGASYGGALALMLAGHDPRVDAVVPMITWNDLAQALFPNGASATPVPGDTPARGVFAGDGVFKQGWAGTFFSAGSPPSPCGRLRPEVCAAFVEAATSGRLSPSTAALLQRSSPATVADRITAPTYLVQGERDTLFGLDHADATARQLPAGTVRKVEWFAGGHDGDAPGPVLRSRVGDWLAYHLGMPAAEDPDTGFSYEVPGGFRGGSPLARSVHAPAYPGLPGAPPTPRQELALAGAAQPVLRPPGASPAAVTSIPGAGTALSALPGALGNALPGQSATFLTDPLPTQTDVTGSSRVRLRVAGLPATSSGGQPAGEALLFAALSDVAPDSTRTLPGGAVAPLRVPLPADGSPVEVSVALPGIVAPVEAGHRLAVTVSTTDQGYAMPRQPAAYLVALANGARLSVPTVPGEDVAAPLPVLPLAGTAVLLVAGVMLALVNRMRRRHADDLDPELASVPLVISGLTKRFPGGLTAVNDLSFRVRHGQVLGLLGPNGAGKTTVLRALMGLIRPTSGQVRVFGHLVTPGAPVLSRLGSFVEGPGFLPHLSGRENLRLYWAATGRTSADAHVEEALDIAGLGAAVHRRVSTYSHGMRQRLAIAQAMLGWPDLLVLDEPTNGLDPPQISQLREVLRSYAAQGRAVLVSSHLLAEVEQTCSDVVVMHRGRLVAQGPVAEIVAGGGEASFIVDDPAAAADVLRSLDGVRKVAVAGSAVQASLDGLPRSAAVQALVAAGLRVEQVGPRRRLEDAFLQLVGEEVVE